MRITLNNDLAEIPRVTEAVTEFATAQGIHAQDLFAIGLCLDELLTNAISYGFEDQDRHEIAVSLALAGDLLTLELQDDGRPFNPLEDAETPDLDANLDERRVGGLGIHFVKTLFDQVNYRRAAGYNCLSLVKRVGLAPP